MKWNRVMRMGGVVLAAAMLVSSTPVYAAKKTDKTTVQKVNTGSAIKDRGGKKKPHRITYKWKKKKGEMYCYADGKKLKGMKKIGKRQYLFSGSDGRQKVGWQKVKGKYYYFRISPGKNASMVKGHTVNHIKLRKNGTAAVTKNNKSRIWVLVRSQMMVEKYTHTTYSHSTKMKQVWRRFQDNYVYHGSYDFANRGKQWEVDLTRDTYENEMGGCYALGAAWAFLSNAIGCKNCYAVSSGGHGWAEVEGYVYDPSWDKTDRKNNYYHRDMKLSGKNHTPNYRRSGRYRKRI